MWKPGESGRPCWTVIHFEESLLNSIGAVQAREDQK